MSDYVFWVRCVGCAAKCQCILGPSSLDCRADGRLGNRRCTCTDKGRFTPVANLSRIAPTTEAVAVYSLHYRTTGSPVWKPAMSLAACRRSGGFFMSERLCTSLWAGLGEGAFAHAGFQRRRSSNLASCPPTPFGSGERASSVFGACHAISPPHPKPVASRHRPRTRPGSPRTALQHRTRPLRDRDHCAPRRQQRL